MNVGIVSKWFNRGQPVVGRYIRSAVEELGHRSFVLAKPRREKGPMAGALERTGVWDQPDVTAASSFETPLAEYEAWVEGRDGSLEEYILKVKGELEGSADQKKEDTAEAAG